MDIQSLLLLLRDMCNLADSLASQILPFVTRPTRYLRGEQNAVHKDPSLARLKVALAFPDAYEIGMSHLGLKILYHILNQDPRIMAERAFAPWIDAEILMRRRGFPLCSHESVIPLSAFDILGFTLQYELSYTNILNMLDLARIPLLRKERDKRHPLVIAGGPCAYNPEPLADFIDLFVIGEAEEAIQDVAEEYLTWKESRKDREDLLSRLSRYPGIYCPGRHESGRIIEKRMIADLDAAPFPTRFIVPFLEIVHDRLNIEVGRGCSQGCRFCQAGMVFRPVRERSPDRIRDLVVASLQQTGYEEVSLFSLNTTEYSRLEPLLPSLMDHLEKHKISLSLPSIRIDGLSLGVLHEIKRVRKTGLTLAPEAGSQRLREVINKGLDEEDIRQAVRVAASAGWEGMKLYFMIGLPHEGEGDLLEIARLSQEAVGWGRAEGGGRFHLTISLSSFIPKPHTPFQWCGQVPMEELKEKHRLLRDRIRGPGLALKWHLPEMSFLEAVFSRGDRALGRALLQAHSLGCRFDGWSDQLRFDRWQEAFSRSDIDPSWYSQRPLLTSEPLPWDHISAGVSKDFLQREYERSEQGLPSPDCGSEGCLGCGMDCSSRRGRRSSSDLPRTTVRKGDGNPGASEGFRLRFAFRKGEEVRYLSHLEMLRAFARALRRADLPISYSRGFHPQPKLAIAWALPVGVCGEEEWGEMELETNVPPAEVAEGLMHHLPRGISLLRVEPIPPSTPFLERSFSCASYTISLEGGAVVQWADPYRRLFSSACTEAFLQETSLPLPVERKGKKITVDIRPLILDLFLEKDGSCPSWRLRLKLNPQGGINPRRVMARFFANYLDEEKTSELVSQLRITRNGLS